jgi:hypothetical protein
MTHSLSGSIPSRIDNNNWKIKKSVFATIKESGISMFYTSVVLLDSVFMLSDFGGTVALKLVAVTVFGAIEPNVATCLV